MPTLSEYEGKTYCIDEGWQEQKDCLLAEVSTLTGECFWKLSDGRCKQGIDRQNSNTKGEDQAC